MKAATKSTDPPPGPPPRMRRHTTPDLTRVTSTSCFGAGPRGDAVAAGDHQHLPSVDANRAALFHGGHLAMDQLARTALPRNRTNRLPTPGPEWRSGPGPTWTKRDKGHVELLRSVGVVQQLASKTCTSRWRKKRTELPEVPKEGSVLLLKNLKKYTTVSSRSGDH